MVNLSHPRNRGEGSGRMRAQRQGREDIVMKPRNPIHPGEMLLEELLRPAGASQRQLAAKLGWTAAKLNELVKGRRGVTADSALNLDVTA